MRDASPATLVLGYLKDRLALASSKLGLWMDFSGFSELFLLLFWEGGWGWGGGIFYYKGH